MEQNKTSEKSLQLKCKRGKFIGTDGKERAYTSYYVEIMGVEVKVVGNDNTGKQLLEIFFKQ